MRRILSFLLAVLMLLPMVMLNPTRVNAQSAEAVLIEAPDQNAQVHVAEPLTGTPADLVPGENPARTGTEALPRSVV